MRRNVSFVGVPTNRVTSCSSTALPRAVIGRLSKVTLSTSVEIPNPGYINCATNTLVPCFKVLFQIKRHPTRLLNNVHIHFMHQSRKVCNVYRSAFAINNCSLQQYYYYYNNIRNSRII